MDLQLFVATHKQYAIPDDEAYLPVHVGRAGSSVTLPYAGDDTGVNISELNPYYCELTALYWGWKNTSHDAWGLVHYRRYFRGAEDRPADGAELAAMLKDSDVIVARRRHYVVQTVQQQYAHSHHARDLQAAREAVIEVDPSYTLSFDALLSARSLSLFNMFLMRDSFADAYCNWLFQVLEATRRRLPLKAYGPQQQRVIGYLGERLLNVWLLAQPDLRVRRQRLYEPERVPGIVAGTRMLGRMAGIGRAH